MTRLIPISKNKIQCRFEPPALPRSQLCDFRQDYEKGMTFLAIGKKYYCDPRTVKSCILHNHNKPSTALGRHTCPTRLSPYENTIDHLINALSDQQKQSIAAVTHRIFIRIQQDGYSGCERTVRNYIDQKMLNKRIIKRKDKKSC